MKKYCVVIPIYKDQLNDNERESVVRTDEIFKEDVFFIAPEGLDCTYYKNMFPSIEYVYFDRKYFKSTQTYSKLLLSIDFYKKFLAYEYMLIVQTDVMILGNKEEFEKYVDMGYDYLGAPWFSGLKLNKYPYSSLNHLPSFIGKPKVCYVGNGGFCMRKVKSSIRLIQKHKLAAFCWANEANEDCFFSYFNSSEYRLAPVEIAEKFALEDRMTEYLNEGKIPFAVHAWEKFHSSNVKAIKEYIKK